VQALQGSDRRQEEDMSQHIGQCGRDCNANQGRDRCADCEGYVYPLTWAESAAFRLVLAIGLVIACFGTAAILVALAEMLP
jgi:hypothetical protein